MKKGRIVITLLIILMLISACGPSIPFPAPADLAPAPAPAAEPSAPAFDLPAAEAPAFDAAPAPPPASADADPPAAEAPPSPAPAPEPEAPPMHHPIEDVADVLPILTPTQMGGRMMSYTVTLSLQTTEFVPGLRLLLDTVGQTGGYLMFELIRGNDMRTPPTPRSADYSFRVPSENLNDFLTMVENNFNIVGRRIVPRDDTATYLHGETQRDDLRTQEQRLITELENEDLSPLDRHSLERELASVRAQLIDLSEQQHAIEHDVLFSVITVELHEVIFEEEEEEYEEEPDSTFNERLDTRIQSSIDAFLAFGQGFLLVIITIAPALVILAILGAITLLIVKSAKKHRRNKKQNTIEIPGNEANIYNTKNDE